MISLSRSRVTYIPSRSDTFPMSVNVKRFISVPLSISSTLLSFSSKIISSTYKVRMARFVEGLELERQIAQWGLREWLLLALTQRTQVAGGISVDEVEVVVVPFLQGSQALGADVSQPPRCRDLERHRTVIMASHTARAPDVASHGRIW